MRPDPRPRRSPAWRTLPGLLLVMASLAGCSLMPGFGNPPPPTRVGPMEAPDAALAAHLTALQLLLQSPPADQAAALAAARRDFEVHPAPSRQLRYALMLATAGHAGADPARAEQLLQPLATLPPGPLGPGEQALARVMLQDVERALALQAEGQHLQGELDRSERDRTVANTRRLQQEIDENAKLRHELEAARAKLDAIANIERGLTRPAP